MFSLFPCDETRLTRPQMFLSLLLIWRSQKERSRGALAREVMRRRKERRKVVIFFPFPVTPLALFAVHASRVKKEDDNSGKWIHCLTNAREQKKPAITSLRPHSKMVNNPFFLIKSNPWQLIRFPMGQKNLAVLTGDRINEGFFYVTVLPRWP